MLGVAGGGPQYHADKDPGATVAQPKKAKWSQMSDWTAMQAEAERFMLY